MYGDAKRQEFQKEFGDITKGLNFGEAVIFRPLPRNNIYSVWSPVRRFWYPGFNVASGALKWTPVNVSGEFFDPLVERSPAEEALLELYRRYFGKRFQGQKLEPLTRIGQTYSFGQEKTRFGCLAEYKGQVRDIIVPDSTYQPTTRQEVEKGIYHYNRLVEGGKLVFTPFLTRFQVTAVKSRNISNLTKTHYRLFTPTPLLDDKFRRILPAEFGDGCIMVHPDDLSGVLDYTSRMIKANNDGDFFAMRELRPAYYRAYPDAYGEVVFVSLMHSVPPVRFNVLENGAFTKSFIEELEKQEYIYTFDPPTQTSLLGGYYYRDSVGKMVETSLERFKGRVVEVLDDGVIAELDDGVNAKLDSSHVVIKWCSGRLWDNRFNPFPHLPDDKTNLLIPIKTAYWLRDEAVKLGIPTVDFNEDTSEVMPIGEPPMPVDFSQLKPGGRQQDSTAARAPESDHIVANF